MIRNKKYREIGRYVGIWLAGALLGINLAYSSLNRQESNLEQNLDRDVIEHVRMDNEWDREVLNFELSPYYQRRAKKRMEEILNHPYDKKEYSERRTKFSRFKDLVRETGLDTSFVEALVLVESKGEPRARSPTGPKGIAQFALDTARRNGAKITKFRDDRYDPVKSIRELLPRHVDEILTMYRRIGIYEPSLEQILVTYHEGELAKERGEALHKRFPNLDGYITEIGALKGLIRQGRIEYRQLDSYLRMLENAKSYKLKKGETLYAVSRKFGMPVSEIMNLNPELRDFNKVPEGYVLRIPNR
jgi:hypothetical protein